MIETARGINSFDNHGIPGVPRAPRVPRVPGVPEVPKNWAMIHAIAADPRGITGRCIALGCFILDEKFTIPADIDLSHDLIEYMVQQIQQHSSKYSGDEKLCIEFMLGLITHLEEGFGDIQRSVCIVACRLARVYKNESDLNLIKKAQYIIDQNIPNPGQKFEYMKIARDTASILKQWSAVLNRATPEPEETEKEDDYSDVFEI